MPHELGVEEVYHVGSEDTNESVATTEGMAGMAKGDVLAPDASKVTFTSLTAAHISTVSPEFNST